MTVSENTGSFYRFPDLTAQAEALFGFIEDTISQELVAELDFLAVFDAAKSKIRNVVEIEIFQANNPTESHGDGRHMGFKINEYLNFPH